MKSRNNFLIDLGFTLILLALAITATTILPIAQLAIVIFTWILVLAAVVLLIYISRH